MNIYEASGLNGIDGILGLGPNESGNGPSFVHSLYTSNSIIQS